MSIAKAAAVLVFNYVAAIAVISLNKRAFDYFRYPAALTTVHSNTTSMMRVKTE